MNAARQALLALALLGVAAAAPAMSLREFRTLEAAGKEGPNYASYYLVGVIEGLRESAEATQRSGQKPPFCVAGRRLEPSMARSLFQGELARNAQLYEADMPVQLVLSAALQSAYRCSP